MNTHTHTNSSVVVLRPLKWRRFEDTLSRHWKILQKFAETAPLCNVCAVAVHKDGRSFQFQRRGKRRSATNSKSQAFYDLASRGRHKWLQTTKMTGCKYGKEHKIHALTNWFKIFCWSELLVKPNCWVGRNVNFVRFGSILSENCHKVVGVAIVLHRRPFSILIVFKTMKWTEIKSNPQILLNIQRFLFLLFFSWLLCVHTSSLFVRQRNKTEGSARTSPPLFFSRHLSITPPLGECGDDHVIPRSKSKSSPLAAQGMKIKYLFSAWTWVSADWQF